MESRDALLTLGIKPVRPETGYGYIQVGEKVADGINKVKTFTEKPDLELAKVFVQSGEFYWNAGIFVWSVAAIKKAFENTLAKKGTSVVEIVSTCNSGWKMTPAQANEWMAEHMTERYPLGDLKNV